ncbi:MASE1 domain-containing protein [Streptomyces sp. NPDC088116]|uniref:MASE1 domain-containing protein n=1 Tax=Streptomyces sp. NPDC088116 TaxID=3365825 RepID=UPI003811ED59
MVRTEEVRHLSVAALRILCVAAVYFASGRLGLLRRVAIEGAVVTPLWPPTGVALSALLLLGLGIWPGIALGTLLVVVTITSFHATDVVIIAGNTLAPVCAYLMLRRVGFRTELDRLRDGAALVFLGALAGMLISATVGSGVLLLSGRLPASGFWSTWLAWWTGDAMGVLLVTPMLLVLRRARLSRVTGRWTEAAALLVTAVVILPLATRSTVPLLFLVFPLLIWSALRFQLAGAVPCALFMSVLTIGAAVEHVGPYAERDLIAVMISLQALNGSAALTALLLSAIVTEQNNVRLKIEQACMELAEVVERLAPGESANRWPSQGP